MPGLKRYTSLLNIQAQNTELCCFSKLMSAYAYRWKVDGKLLEASLKRRVQEEESLCRSFKNVLRKPVTGPREYIFASRLMEGKVNGSSFWLGGIARKFDNLYMGLLHFSLMRMIAIGFPFVAG